MPASRAVNRRRFLQTSTAAVVTGGVWSQLGLAESKSLNEKLQVACVGVANRAADDMEGVKGEAIVALCEVDKNYLAQAHEEFPDARLYDDYREMIDQERDRIDAVVVGTPDHHHAPASIRAIRAGKHVYCEKPLTHTVQEARILTEAARQQGVATQLGTQIHANDNYRRVVEIVQSGAIGDVNEVHVWVGKGWSGGELPTETEAPPANLDWDLWIGPAEVRPFAAGRYHPGQWRRWWDFGGGTMADMACHFMDLPFWALKLRYPTSCVANGPPVQQYGCPSGLTVEYEFPSRETLPPLKLTWYDGDRIPKVVAGQRVPGSGVMFVGSAGKMFADYSQYRLFPSEDFADYQPPEQTIAPSIGHHAEWIKACKDGSPTTCHFDYSGPLTEAVLLGNVSYRTGKRLEWDAENLRATNCPEADALIQKQYRVGWEVV